MYLDLMGKKKFPITAEVMEASTPASVELVADEKVADKA
jgi:hypothetical protein